MCASPSISLAEAAFLVSATERDVHRLIATQILPPSLTLSGEPPRLIPFAAPLASFCFGTRGKLTRLAQERVIRTIIERMRARPDYDQLMGLREYSAVVAFDWTVKWSCLSVNVWPFAAPVLKHWAPIADARSAILSQADVIGRSQ